MIANQTLLHISARLLVALPAFLALQASAEPETLRYNHGAQINLRAKPSQTAKILAVWPINQQVILIAKTDSRWCEVTSESGNRRGYVDCSYLKEAPLTISQIEFDATNAALELNRLTLLKKSGENGQASRQQAELRIIDRLFSLLERHFAISPSLYTYQDYQGLLEMLSKKISGQEAEELHRTKLPALIWMRASLSRDFVSNPAPTIRHAVSQHFNEVLLKRRFGTPNQVTTGSAIPDARSLASPNSEPIIPSLFQKDIWATGWAGGNLVRKSREPGTNGSAYSVGFSGVGPISLAAVYEMAKTHELKIKATFSSQSSTEAGEISMLPGSSGETLVLEMQLPVWAITEKGLVPGILRKISYGGDECFSNASIPTHAEIRFASAIKGSIHGIFATNATFDAARADIKVSKATFLDSLGSPYENTLTHRETMHVDLNGDGIADIRTLISNDTAVSKMPSPGFRLAKHTLQSQRHFRRVAGWYAYNVYSIQSNDEGRWSTLSLYNLVTCT